MATFRDLEKAGWTEKAEAYDEHFASVTRQAITPILDIARPLSGRQLLDVCCGTGDLAQEALKEGAKVTGIDFAPTMVEIASAKVPSASFHAGDAENLEFPPAHFDILTCAFGLWHIADADRAIAEFARVLRSGGLLVYTGWVPPSDTSQMMGLLVAAINKHGTMDVDLPASPPPYRFATVSEAVPALETSGFTEIEFREEIAVWTGTNGTQLLDLIYKSIVRAPMLIEAQTPSAQKAINLEIISSAERLKSGGRITMNWPYLLVKAKR